MARDREPALDPLQSTHRQARARRGDAAGRAVRRARLLGRELRAQLRGGVARPRAAAGARGGGAARRAAAAGAFAGIVRHRAADRAGRARPADRARRRHRRRRVRDARPRRAPGARAARPRSGWRSCCSATRCRHRRRTSRPPRCSRVLGGAALVALHRPLAAVAFDPAGAGSLGVRATPVRSRWRSCSRLRCASRCRGSGTCWPWPCVVAPPLAVRRHVRSVPAAMLGGAAVGAAAGLAGIYASYGLDVAAGAAVALALCAAAAIGALRAGQELSDAAAASGLRPAATPRRARQHHPHADQLRQGEAERGLVVAADELDEQPLDPRDHEVEGEQDARPVAVAEVPQHDRGRPPSRASRRSASGAPSTSVGTVPFG